MKISEIISYLEKKKEEIGDVPIYTLSDDGRSTWVSGYEPQLVYEKHWQSKVKLWFVQDKGW